MRMRTTEACCKDPIRKSSTLLEDAGSTLVCRCLQGSGISRYVRETAAYATGSPVRRHGLGAGHFRRDNGATPRETPRHIRQQSERGNGTAAVGTAE